MEAVVVTIREKIHQEPVALAAVVGLGFSQLQREPAVAVVLGDALAVAVVLVVPTL
jgi:hypothetical protein